jgi:hypothetical protein
MTLEPQKQKVFSEESLEISQGSMDFLTTKLEEETSFRAKLVIASVDSKLILGLGDAERETH